MYPCQSFHPPFFLCQNLNKLAELVRGELPKLIRNIIGALITIDVHARDIVTQMVHNKVTAVTPSIPNSANSDSQLFYKQVRSSTVQLISVSMMYLKGVENELCLGNTIIYILKGSMIIQKDCVLIHMSFYISPLFPSPTKTFT